jgi:tetratricopeptide (TPR) repeat protein
MAKDKFRKLYEEGMKFHNKQKYRDAILAFDQALDADPNNTLAWFYQGDCYSLYCYLFCSGD